MIYIYDMLVDNTSTKIEYLGDEYRLANITKKGSFEFYTYLRKGCEQIIAVPAFAKEFEECCKKFDKMKKLTQDSAVRIHIRERFKTEPQVYEFENGVSSVYDYEITYKHICITMELNGDHLKLLPDFTIVSGNIFGNLQSVDVRENERLSKYCED